jgi:alanine racemase
MSTQRHRPTRAEIDAGAIARNTARLLAAAGDGAQLCAVVKADGYGHGSVTAARAVLAGGATWLAVALVEEGAVLRAAGIDAPVLLLSEPPVRAAQAAVELDLTPTVYRPEFLRALEAVAATRGAPVRVHVKLDTGMTRVGVAASDRDAVLALLAASELLEVEGCQTHLARADEPDLPTTAQQLERFAEGLVAMRRHGLSPRLVHVANTAGTLLHTEAWRAVLATHAPDAVPLVRAGIGIYGLDPGAAVAATDHGLEPALRLVTEVSYVRRVAAGTPVSYGHRWAAPSDGWLATLPIGYADGVPRALTGRLEVLHAGVRRPVVGTVTMDQVLMWCADDRPEVGDEVVLLGSQPATGGQLRIGMEAWAGAIGTITYEIATGISARVPRDVVGLGGRGPDGAGPDGAGEVLA